MSLSGEAKKLNIGYTRTCSCPPNHLNCLTRKEWLKAQIGVWEFCYEGRDVRDKNIHPATFPIALPRRCIELFTHKGELVLDPFVGSGSTLVAARDLQRNAVGFDLNPKYVDYANRRLAQLTIPLPGETTRQIAICDDAINIPRYLNEETVSLCVSSPPYADLLNRPTRNLSRRSKERFNDYYGKVLQYSDSPRDLGTMEPKQFVAALAEIYKGILPLLKPKAHCVINVGELWKNNRRHSLQASIIDAMEKVGYELRNIIIWDKRKLVNRTAIFGWPSNYITVNGIFEYILDFWRP
jgi:DNA modification methylase